MVAEKLIEVRNRIVAVCGRSGRKPQDVLLVAVSKTFGWENVREAMSAGQQDFGENYVQELTEKRRALDDPNVRWHYIGHLQSNKAKDIVEFIHLIHSVDNEHVAKELERRAEKTGKTIDILLEVRTTEEATKFGVLPAKTVDLAKSIAGLKRVRIRGLMTMGPFSEDPNDSRPFFRQLADLKRSIEAEGIDNVTMRHLSMGMTHDFEVAIEEGATIVRIGTAIFGKRKRALNEQMKGAL
jgi:pyridoxal phosphate enzyme (YggS family)